MMNMGKETLQRLHGEMKQAIRLNYYPICSRPELVLGVSPHSDCSTMSLLLQDDEVSALQIQHEGHWVPIEPIPRALVVNVGDIFEVNDTESTSFLFQNSTNYLKGKKCLPKESITIVMKLNHHNSLKTTNYVQ